MYLSHYLSKGLQTIMPEPLMRDSKHTAELVFFFNLFGSFQFRDYLNLVRIPKYKYSLVKLRLASRLKKMPFCTSLEDEFHFLFECKLQDGQQKF